MVAKPLWHESFCFIHSDISLAHQAENYLPTDSELSVNTACQKLIHLLCFSGFHASLLFLASVMLQYVSLQHKDRF